jgi:hypothetical protein
MMRAVFVFICLLLAVFLLAGLEAQQARKMVQIGYLSPQSGTGPLVRMFK